MRIRFFAMVAAVGLAAIMMAPRLQAQASASQSPALKSPSIPQWQTDAGGKMAFDVASVKPNKSGGRPYSNGPFTSDTYPPTGGLFSATNYPLMDYLGWAYHITGYQYSQLPTQLPSWAVGDGFDIEARAAGNPTKAQMKLMMQSLLADRFKLAVHTETKQSPVYALVLAKPGKTGPQLKPHVDDGSCSTKTPTLGAPPVCGAGSLGMQPSPSAPGRLLVSARNVTMEQIVDWLPLVTTRVTAGLDRPVVDRTRLSGNFDFSVEFIPEIIPPGATFQPDPTGPIFLEALQEQLGLRLEPSKGPVSVLVIDHVEEPMPN